MDYDQKLISKGGGVFSRTAKSIKISPEMKKAFDIQESKLTPSELITALLKAPVDLIWNGGIGTYVKSSQETNADVGDKANDVLRVNGSELRCKVFGEGGNLGLTQLGRIEFCRNGGSCNSDFIDNAAGVDCSDHEVNIKILLDDVVKSGDMTDKQRNQLLEDMTDEVSSLVLSNNYKQGQAISLAQSQASSRFGEYIRFINHLEKDGLLNRELEFLPSDEAMNERREDGEQLTRPELSVLISYAKVQLKEVLCVESLASDEYMMRSIETAFPQELRQRYPDKIYGHRLRKEIIATQVANDMVNHMGFSFAQRQAESTGASLVEVAKAYVCARDIYSMHDGFAEIERLDHTISSEVQLQMLSKLMRRMRRSTRWFVRNRRGNLLPANEVANFREDVLKMSTSLPEVMSGAPLQEWKEEVQMLVEAGVPQALAHTSALPATIYSSLNVVEAARHVEADTMEVAKMFYAVGDYLDLHWFATQISEVHVEGYWQAAAREVFIDDIASQMRSLVVSIMRMREADEPTMNVIGRWADKQVVLMTRWKQMIDELKSTKTTDYAMFSVALRELLDLAQASQHSVN